ncbi:hypothetical protein V6N12_027583 [Hibiscus sabdariffa]|uniref:BHLH domain-containing protein n=1 Tax=Hibiscus sabdariffa TaxID=183260 RepID=A0ABR2F3F0_9ROSI
MEIRTMMENKRSPCSVDHSDLTSLASKRQKSKKDKKDQVGERIVALQQLVSPYGKTETASVLLEAKEYIRFLHEQVKALTKHSVICLGILRWRFYGFMFFSDDFQVLSAPYLQTIPTHNLPAESRYCLRNRGLCLVPVSCTAGVARSNGADIWAPIKTTSPKFDKKLWGVTGLCRPWLHPGYVQDCSDQSELHGFLESGHVM